MVCSARLVSDSKQCISMYTSVQVLEGDPKNDFMGGGTGQDVFELLELACCSYRHTKCVAQVCCATSR